MINLYCWLIVDYERPVSLLVVEGVKSLLDCNKVVIHLDQGLWEETELK